MGRLNLKKMTEKTELQKSEAEDDTLDNQEIPESDIITLNIILPSSSSSSNKSDPKKLEIQVSLNEIIQELHSILQTEYPETCHRTNFSLYFNNNKLDGFSEIGSIEDIKDQSCLYIIEEPYNLKEAKFHIKHIRQLLRSVDGFDANRGLESQSFSFVSDFLDKI